MSLNSAHKGLTELTGPGAEAGAEPGRIRGFGGNLGAFRIGLSGRQWPLHPGSFAVPPKHRCSRRGSPWGRWPSSPGTAAGSTTVWGRGAAGLAPRLAQVAPQAHSPGRAGPDMPQRSWHHRWHSHRVIVTSPCSATAHVSQPRLPMLMSLQVVRVPRCPSGSAQLCQVPRCPPGSAQLLSTDVGPWPSNRIKCQANSPCTAVAAGGQAVLRAHSPFIHGKK